MLFEVKCYQTICHFDKNKHYLQHFVCVLGLDRCGLRYLGTFSWLLFGQLDLCIGEVVYSGKLNESREDEGKADSDEPVHCSGVRDLWKGVTSTDTKCRHGQDSGDAFSGVKNRTKSYICT